MKSLYPDYTFNSISQITASMLLNLGMEAVVLDIDNTLVPHNDPEPTREVRRFLNDMRKNGIKLCVVSNNSKDRVEPFCKKLGIKFFVYSAFKPAARGYVKAAEKMGTEPKKTAAIGDQIFTDIWGGNRAGCVTMLVKPIKLGNEGDFIALKRKLEKIIIERMEKR